MYRVYKQEHKKMTYDFVIVIGIYSEKESRYGILFESIIFFLTANSDFYLVQNNVWI